MSVRHWHQGATARLSAAPKAVAPAVSTAIVAVEGKSGYERRKARHFKLRKRVSAHIALSSSVTLHVYSTSSRGPAGFRHD